MVSYQQLQSMDRFKLSNFNQMNFGKQSWYCCQFNMVDAATSPDKFLRMDVFLVIWCTRVLIRHFIVEFIEIHRFCCFHIRFLVDILVMEGLKLTDPELRLYGELFSLCDLDNSGAVSPSKATELFLSSGLPQEVLQKVIFFPSDMLYWPTCSVTCTNEDFLSFALVLAYHDNESNDEDKASVSISPSSFSSIFSP